MISGARNQFANSNLYKIRYLESPRDGAKVCIKSNKYETCNTQGQSVLPCRGVWYDELVCVGNSLKRTVFN